MAIDSELARVFGVKFAEVVFVLHAFQKKSKHGVSTPPREIEKVKQRLAMAADTYRQTYTTEKP